MLGFAARAISVALTIVYLLVSAVACSVTIPEPADLPKESIPLGSSGSGLSLTILQSRAEDSMALQKAADLYCSRKENPIPIRVQTIASEEDYRTTLRSKLLAGEPADLFHLTQYSDMMELESYLSDLSRLDWIFGALGGSGDAVSLNGKILAAPHSIEGSGLIVNRAMFEAAGITTDSLGSFEGLRDGFTELQSLIDQGSFEDACPNLTAVTNLAGGDRDYLAGRIGDLLLSESFPNQQSAYRSPSLSLVNKNAAGSLVDCLIRNSPSRNSWPELCQVEDWQLMEDGLAAERIAAVLHTTDAYQRTLEQNPDFAGRLALLPVPMEGLEESFVFVDVPVWWGVSSQSDPAVREQAMDFLTWLYRSEEGIRFYADEFQSLSPYREGARESDNPLHQQLLAYLNQDQALPSLHSYAPKGFGEQVLVPELQEYFTSYEYSWETAATRCEEGWLTLNMEENADSFIQPEP